MLTRDRIIDILKDAGVLMEGHFLLTSGRHSDKYMQCARIFQSTATSAELCGELVEKFRDKQIDVVVGPALGAIQMAYEVARQLGVPNMFTERDSDGKMALRRGFSIEKGQRVLIVENVITTGGSVREVMDILNELGAEIMGVGVMVDRSAGKIDFGVPTEAVLSVEVESWEPHSCPLCKAGTPVVKPGSRKLPL